jgi:hypothetical protein
MVVSSSGRQEEAQLPLPLLLQCNAVQCMVVTALLAIGAAVTRATQCSTLEHQIWYGSTQ